MLEIPSEIKSLLREMSYTLVETMIMEKFPFRLILWNNDNWDKPLPDNTMASFPSQIVIDIKEDTLINSFVEDSTGDIILSTMFEGTEFSKVLLYDEVVAIIDGEGQPFILNNFMPDISIEEKIHYNAPLNKKEVTEMIANSGVGIEDAERSINTFIKYNPNLSKIFS